MLRNFVCFLRLQPVMELFSVRHGELGLDPKLPKNSETLALRQVFLASFAKNIAPASDNCCQYIFRNLYFS